MKIVIIFKEIPEILLRQSPILPNKLIGERSKDRTGAAYRSATRLNFYSGSKSVHRTICLKMSLRI
jgi:hypothetical protein